MNEFKTGDKVELIESVAGFGVGTIGIVKEVLKDTFWNHLKVELKSGPILTSHIKCFKKVGEVRPNLKNRDECLERIYGKQPKSNVEKVFDMLGVKPNEIFYIRSASNHNICVSDKFYFDDRLKLCCKNPNLKYDIYLGDLFNGKYIMVEIPRPLLTDEEKEFLKNFEFKTLKISGNDHCILVFCLNNGDYRTFTMDFVNLKFNGLERGKTYTKEELDL